MELLKLIRKLHRLTGKLNLHLYYQRNKPDVIRLKEEIKAIRQLISEIEIKIDCV